MSKTVSAPLLAHIAGDTITVALCAKLTRTDTTEFFFTEHDQPIVYSGDTYEPTTIVARSNYDTNSKLSVDNMEVTMVFDSANITETDLFAGLYDNAQVDWFLINWEDTSMGIIQLSRGTLGQISTSDDQFSVDIRSLTDKLQNNIGRFYLPTCDAALGDSRCGVNLAGFTVTSTVTAVTSNSNFDDNTRVEANGWFDGGLLTWTSGNNNGLSMEVKAFAGTNFELFLPMHFDIQVGDGFSVYAGCDFTRTTCITKFSNLDNFRGFSFIPGVDRMVNLLGS